MSSSSEDSILQQDMPQALAKVESAASLLEEVNELVILASTYAA